MNAKEALRSQYLATLEMLKQAIEKCPTALWNDPDEKNRFWHIAYHALFYTHLYLQVSEKEFKPWAEHREEYQFMGPLPWPPRELPKIGKPYTKDEVLSYLNICQAEVKTKIDLLDLDSETSGFSWHTMSKFEFQIYNIRHLQQHTGELMERLGAREHIDVDWISKKTE
jgi:hypothetical protein